VDKWLDALKKSASAARGWVMVGYDLNDGSLFNYLLDSQNLWAVYNMVPVLALDVYEHAYVRDFGATPDGRKQYVEAFLRNVNWDHVNRQVAQAEAGQAWRRRDGAARAGGRRSLSPARAAAVPAVAARLQLVCYTVALRRDRVTRVARRCEAGLVDAPAGEEGGAVEQQAAGHGGDA
jgi:Iron/manganese superoxide dismutases, C-terminal domain